MYDLLVSTIEAGLSFVLTMIFLQSVPLLVERKGKQQALETEEIVCLIILLASVLTGTTDWFVYDASIQHIFTRYLVLVFAFIACCHRVYSGGCNRTNIKFSKCV